jgi:hypothetical protein
MISTPPNFVISIPAISIVIIMLSSILTPPCASSTSLSFTFIISSLASSVPPFPYSSLRSYLPKCVIDTATT